MRQQVVTETQTSREMETAPEPETTHPPEVVAEAMAQERARLRQEDPETAAALAEARATENRMRDPVDQVERELTEEAETRTQKAQAIPRPQRATPPRRSSPKTSGQARRPSARAASDEDGGRSRSFAGVAEDLADAAQAGARRARAPREDDWTEFLTILFGFMSMLFIWWLLTGIETPISRQERDDLELTEDEAEGLARPAARILARSFINDRYGKHVLGASDYIVMAVVLTAYAERVGPHVRRKLARPARREQPAERVTHTTRGAAPVEREEVPLVRQREVVEEPTGPPQPQGWPGVWGAAAT